MTIIPFLPDDPLVYTLSYVDEVNVEKCRTVSKGFKNLIDERQPFPEYYIRAKKLHIELLILLENDDQLKSLTDSIKNKRKKFDYLPPSGLRILSSCFPIISNWYWTSQLEISGLMVAAIERKKLICEQQHVNRDILLYKHIRRCPKVLQPIIDIFGSMSAFEKLPLFDIGDRKKLIISAKEMSAPLMRGIRVDGRIFFVLRATNKEDKTRTITQTFTPWDTKRAEWVTKEKDGQIIQTKEYDINVSEISKIKKFIETKQNKHWIHE